MKFGAIEAGGTKFVCGVGTSPGDLATIEIPTRTPDITIPEVIAYFQNHRLDAIGIGSFGPVADGKITNTPKTEWRDTDLAGAIRNSLRIPVGFDTDVNAAAMGEARWGAAQQFSDFVYITVGTGIGGGVIASGRVVHGTGHPEIGHMRIPREPGDSFAGCCPFHSDCLEGLASGPAIAARWNKSANELPPDHPAWKLEARYLAIAIANLTCTLAPARIIIGGGVMRQKALFEMIREEVKELMGGYMQLPTLVAPALGERSGVAGALVLAEEALMRLVEPPDYIV